MTLTGSLMAAGKLMELKWVPQRPVTYPLQNVTNIGLLLLALVLGILLVLDPVGPWAAIIFPTIIGLSLLFGVLLIIPIGGADMPTVISILNSYAGLSAVAMGFVLDNKLLIVAGALGRIERLDSFHHHVPCDEPVVHECTLRSISARFKLQRGERQNERYKEETPEGAAQVLDQASLVVIIPGYGLAVAQAQHRVRELYDVLSKKGITVKFGIHPVAGRMPGHMNVLLAGSGYSVRPAG